jgi:hypothetical protein
LLILGVTPITIYYSQKKIEKKYIEHIDWGNDNTVHNIKCSLKTRLKDERIEYIFKADYGNKDYEITSFNICFYDSVGFLLYDFNINDWTNIVDSDRKRIGISATASTSYSGKAEEYGQFYSYDVKLVEKR